MHLSLSTRIPLQQKYWKLKKASNFVITIIIKKNKTMKPLPSILLTIMLAFCVFVYIKYSHVAKYQNQLIYQAEMQSATINSLNEKMSGIIQEKDQLANHVIEIESENKKLKLTPIKIITKTINKNEKITPVSNYSSQYYNRFLSKRYENK